MLDMLLGLPDGESVYPGLHPNRGVVASVAIEDVKEWGDTHGSCKGRNSEDNERGSMAGACRLDESTTAIGLELDIGYVLSSASGDSSAPKGTETPSAEGCTMLNVAEEGRVFAFVG